MSTPGVDRAFALPKKSSFNPTSVSQSVSSRPPPSALTTPRLNGRLRSPRSTQVLSTRSLGRLYFATVVRSVSPSTQGDPRCSLPYTTGRDCVRQSGGGYGERGSWGGVVSTLPCRDQSPSCRLGSPVSYFAVPLPAFTSCRRSAVASTLYGSAAPSQTQVLSTRSRGQLKATEQHPLTAALQRGDAKSGGGGCLRNVWRGRQQVRSRNDRDTRSGERPRDPLLRREDIPVDAQWAVARRLRALHVRDK